MVNAMFRPVATAILRLAFRAPFAEAPNGGPDDLSVRVIDVGAGHAAAVRLPGGFHMVHDAGNFNDDGKSALAGTGSVIADGEHIDLMVLSQSNADYLGAVDEILDSYTVHRIIRPGYVRDTITWRRTDAAIEAACNSGTEVINLAHFPLTPSHAYRFGETRVTVVSGFSRPRAAWDSLDSSEERNAGSIVVRLLYKGSSVLFTGDAVGRK